MSPVIPWILSLLTLLAPPERLAALPQLPGWEETAEQKLTRYESIAADLYAVTYAPEARLPYRGKRGRAASTALLVAVAFMESGFARDVDRGPCYRGGSFRTRCDGGLSAGLWQARLGAGETLESIHGVGGLTQADLFGDRKKAAAVAMHMIVRSFKACRLLGPEALLNVYASGSCSRGQVPALARLKLARRLLADRPPPWKDDAQHVVGHASGGEVASSPVP